VRCLPTIHANAVRILTRAKQLLGWAPSVPFKDGIRRTVEYFAKRFEEQHPPLTQTAHNE
jgi:nucleoside-diphosphate-sugar epimerase